MIKGAWMLGLFDVPVLEEKAGKKKKQNVNGKVVEGTLMKRHS